MNWGNKILLVMILFVVGIISMVVISVKQDFYLVEENYYEEELAYQEKIDELRNAQSWPYEISVEQSTETLSIQFENASESDGKIHLFCPSDARFDQLIPLSNSVEIQKSELKRGKWKVFIKWNHNNKNYQKSIDIMI